MASAFGVHVRPPPPPGAAQGTAGSETVQGSMPERRLGMVICAATVVGTAGLLLVVLLAALP